jgi:hypothetical protein
MKAYARVIAVTAVLASAGGVGPVWPEDPLPPDLPYEHIHPSGAFTFRTPQDWKVAVSAEDPLAVETGGGGMLARFLFKRENLGYDIRHVTCMLERLAPEEEQHPRVKYEHDFLTGESGDLRFIDSAFVIDYVKPIGGHKKWWQRNVTIVGEGVSLCVITYAPYKLWKKSEETRLLLDAVLESVKFRDESEVAPAPEPAQ